MTQPDTLSSRLDALEKLAKAATPGGRRWQMIGTHSASGAFHAYLLDDADRKIAVFWGKADEKAANADLAVECNPSAILALIGQVRDLLGRGK